MSIAKRVLITNCNTGHVITTFNYKYNELIHNNIIYKKSYE